ncbi:MAG: (Uracil-5)-methyltransferase [Gemmatimonadetes bacterium]|nr:(Uracil-5)-methyltransferase [Gemmatimonadota bacterium]
MSDGDATGEVEIASIAAGGEGVGRTEGLVLFVPRTAPGDRVRVRYRTGKRFAHARMESLLQPSDRRVEPACGHYVVDRCGGCQLQHLAYDAQLDAKRGIIRDAIVRVAKRDAGLPDVRESDRPWRYRRKLTLAMRLVSGRWVMGLHRYDDPVGVFDLADCPITEEPVLEAWKAIRAASEFLPRVPALRGAVQLGAEGASVLIEGAGAWPDHERFFAALPGIVALWWQPEKSRRRLLHSRSLDGSRTGASFTQVNESVAGRLREHVLGLARAIAPETAIDAYAGMGDTAVALAAMGARVTAIELDREAAARCAERLPPGSRAIAGAVERELSGALPAALVLVNPPRTGMDALASQVLQDVVVAPRSLIYVSCDPATLARDLARMPRYRIVSMLGFDMFPQTAHVETVCELRPEGA